MPVTILTEAELRACVGVDAEAVAAIEEAFTWLADGQVEMPPIMHIAVPEHRGDVDIKSAYARGLDHFAVKIGAGFFDNHKLGLPNSPASVVLVSARTGVVAAVLLDNAYLTDVRTGAAGAVVAEHLAPKRIETAGVIGSGPQARYQMRGLKEVRDFGRLLIHGIDAPGVAAYVAEMPAELGVEVVAVDAETLVRESQVVVTTTPSREPIIEAGWLHPGLHITAMGADLAGKRELGPGVPEAAGPGGMRPQEPVLRHGGVAARRPRGGPSDGARRDHGRPRAGAPKRRGDHPLRPDRDGCTGHGHRGARL